MLSLVYLTRWFWDFGHSVDALWVFKKGLVELNWPTVQPGKRLVRGEGVLELCDWPALQRNKMADRRYKG